MLMRKPKAKTKNWVPRPCFVEFDRDQGREAGANPRPRRDRRENPLFNQQHVTFGAFLRRMEAPGSVTPVCGPLRPPAACRFGARPRRPPSPLVVQVKALMDGFRGAMARPP